MIVFETCLRVDTKLFWQTIREIVSISLLLRNKTKCITKKNMKVYKYTMRSNVSKIPGYFDCSLEVIEKTLRRGLFKIFFATL